VTVDTGAYITVKRTQIADGRTTDSSSKRCPGRPSPFLKDVYLTLALGQLQLKIWGFVANISNEFIMGLDILRDYDASVDVGRQTSRLAISACEVGKKCR
jgi:hypothetical protein